MTESLHNLFFSEEDPDIKGFQEVVFSVSDLERWISFFERICGWQLISRCESDKGINPLWQLDNDAIINEAVLGNSGDKEGFVRLVQFNNVGQEQIRSGAHAWDTGGIFDVNIRTHDIAEMYREFQREGWHGYADPLRYNFGEYDVSEVLMKGPHGITIAAMQRFAPPLQGFPHMKKTSRFFNSSIVSADMAVSHDFYINKLGFNMFFQTPGTDRKEGHNVLGIPQNLNDGITVPVDIVRPDINNFGSIEYLQTKELKGKDCSNGALPPNLGILMLRFPVRDAAQYAELIRERGVKLNSTIHVTPIAPYGNIKSFSVRSPEGAWLEFMELIK